MAVEENGLRKDGQSPHSRHDSTQQSPKGPVTPEQSPAQASLSFPYDRLEDPTTQIRLCRILPGSHPSRLKVTLETRALESVDGKFSALSYAWGEKPSAEPIFLNGVLVDETSEGLTRNLHTYLSRLRKIRFEGLLWVDALCVDQQNKDEKEAQVALMSSLFKRANNVIILLDEDCNCLQQAKADHSLIKSVIDQLAHDVHPRRLNCCLAQSTTVPALEDFTRVAYRFLDSAWFTRVWTVQETVLSRQSCILFADGLFPWTTFEEASEKLHAHLKADCCAHIVENLDPEFEEGLHRIYTHISAIKHIRDRLPEKPSIFEAMLCFQHLGAKLPRDKFNGFRGLHRADSELPAPDYTKSDGEVYEDLTIWLLGNEDDLVALALDLNDGDADLPSWVLNLSLAPKLNANYWRGQIELYMAYECRFDSGRSFDHTAPGKLRLDAIKMDVISDVAGGFFTEDMEMEDYLTQLRKWSAFASGQKLSDGSGDLFSDEFCATVLGGRIKDPKSCPGLRAANKDDYAQWRHAVSAMTRSRLAESEHAAVISSHLTAVMRRGLFRTRKGSLGLGIPTMRRGDTLHLFSGARAPFATRRLPDTIAQEPQYLLLGYCYHQKLMEGHLDVATMFDHATTCVLAVGKKALLRQDEGHDRSPGS